MSLGPNETPSLGLFIQKKYLIYIIPRLYACNFSRSTSPIRTSDRQMKITLPRPQSKRGDFPSLQIVLSSKR